MQRHNISLVEAAEEDLMSALAHIRKSTGRRRLPLYPGERKSGGRSGTSSAKKL